MRAAAADDPARAQGLRPEPTRLKSGVKTRRKLQKISELGVVLDGRHGSRAFIPVDSAEPF